jgi:hypothetical protein
MRIKASNLIVVKNGAIVGLYTFTSDREACVHFANVLGKYQSVLTLSQGFDLAKEDGYWTDNEGMELMILESE